MVYLWLWKLTMSLLMTQWVFALLNSLAISANALDKL